MSSVEGLRGNTKCVAIFLYRIYFHANLFSRRLSYVYSVLGVKGTPAHGHGHLRDTYASNSIAYIDISIGALLRTLRGCLVGLSVLKGFVSHGLEIYRTYCMYTALVYLPGCFVTILYLFIFFKRTGVPKSTSLNPLDVATGRTSRMIPPFFQFQLLLQELKTLSRYTRVLRIYDVRKPLAGLISAFGLLCHELVRALQFGRWLGIDILENKTRAGVVGYLLHGY